MGRISIHELAEWQAAGRSFELLDVRRAIVRSADLKDATVADIMTASPRVIGPEKLTAEAVEMMDTHKINQIPVADENGILIGALNMHDLFKAKAL